MTELLFYCFVRLHGGAGDAIALLLLSRVLEVAIVPVAVSLGEPQGSALGVFKPVLVACPFHQLSEMIVPSIIAVVFFPPSSRALVVVNRPNLDGVDIAWPIGVVSPLPAFLKNVSGPVDFEILLAGGERDKRETGALSCWLDEFTPVIHTFFGCLPLPGLEVSLLVGFVEAHEVLGFDLFLGFLEHVDDGIEGAGALLSLWNNHVAHRSVGEIDVSPRDQGNELDTVLLGPLEWELLVGPDAIIDGPVGDGCERLVLDL